MLPSFENLNSIPCEDFESIFRNLPGLYLILNEEFNIVEVNDAYANATLTKRDEIIGRNIFEVFPDNPNDETANGVRNLRASLNFVRENLKPHTMAFQKYDIRREDGTFEIRYWSPKNLPVLATDGSLHYIIHRVEDVTDYIAIRNAKVQSEELTQDLKLKVQEMEAEILRRSNEIHKINQQLEEKVRLRTETLRFNESKLQLQNQQLISKNKELEQFTYITSHDLQEPLRTIGAFVNLIKEEYADVFNENIHQYLAYIDQSASRMQQLIAGLMVYSKIGRDNNLEDVDCNALMEHVLTDMAASLQEANASVRTHNLPILKAQPTEMRQLFQNLLSNSLKFRKKDTVTRITIAAQNQPQGGWCFEFSDNGIGIDKKNLEEIFTIFKRLHNRNDYPGTGIGLAHCKKIVEHHGGEIWVESEPGEGCTFKFTLNPKYEN